MTEENQIVLIVNGNCATFGKEITEIFNIRRSVERQHLN